MSREKTGMRRNLTSYGDANFSLYLRKAFIKAMGYTEEALRLLQHAEKSNPEAHRVGVLTGLVARRRPGRTVRRRRAPCRPLRRRR